MGSERETDQKGSALSLRVRAAIEEEIRRRQKEEERREEKARRLELQQKLQREEIEAEIAAKSALGEQIAQESGVVGMLKEARDGLAQYYPSAVVVEGREYEVKRRGESYERQVFVPTGEQPPENSPKYSYMAVLAWRANDNPKPVDLNDFRAWYDYVWIESNGFNKTLTVNSAEKSLSKDISAYVFERKIAVFEDGDWLDKKRLEDAIIHAVRNPWHKYDFSPRKFSWQQTPPPSPR